MKPQSILRITPLLMSVPSVARVGYPRECGVWGRQEQPQPGKSAVCVHGEGWSCLDRESPFSAEGQVLEIRRSKTNDGKHHKGNHTSVTAAEGKGWVKGQNQGILKKRARSV